MAMKARPAALANSCPCGAELPLRHLRRDDLQEQIEPLDHKAEGHHRDGGADPGEKGSLVGGVVAVTLDHWIVPMTVAGAL